MKKNWNNGKLGEMGSVNLKNRAENQRTREPEKEQEQEHSPVIGLEILIL